MPNELIASTGEADIILSDEEKTGVTVKFRPFSLKDLAWLRNEFDTPEKQDGLIKGDLHTMARMVWQMMEAKSKKLFADIKIIVESFDEESEEVSEIEIKGYQRLLYTMDEENLAKLYAHCLVNQKENGFKASKKKEVPQKKNP